MNADDFDLRKTGRFRVPEEKGPMEDAPDAEATQKRPPPLARPSPKPREDPAFDKRKTSLFIRPILLPEAQAEDSEAEEAKEEADVEPEPTTGEFERDDTRRFRRPLRPDE